MLNPLVLRKERDFNALYTKGKSMGGRFTILFYRKNGLSFSRKGFLASKKVGNAVQRNRARRLMKESVRLIEAATPLKPGYDVLFIARNSINDKNCADVKKQIEAAMKRTELI